MRGRKPVPPYLKLLRGNPGKRAIHPEPQPKSAGVPEPPDYLLPLAADAWRRLAPELTRLGLLTVLDHHAFAAYCTAFSRWLVAERQVRQLDDNFIAWSVRENPLPHPLLKIASSAASHFLKIGNEFGLTPASRSRLKACEEPSEGKFDGLLGS
jgi:P27 family predicted phage terminase small subunit